MKTLYFLLFVIKIIALCLSIIIFLLKRKKRIGIVGLGFGFNIGNNLVKYAIYIKLSELGFSPYIIGTNWKNRAIYLKNKVKCRIIKNNYTEIKKKEYDILMVNSDQTWRRFDRHFYDIAFLKFAENWNITKFIYGASLGYSNWKLTKMDENIAKKSLKNFKGISVREKNAIKLIKNHLGITPSFVLDPTLLINKNYYLELIKFYKPNNNNNEKFIFTYIFKKEKNTLNFINNASRILGFKIYNVKLRDKNSVEKFIYGIVNCQAVITNSFHGTIFSIIFNKPFVSFLFKDSPKERFISLKEEFKIENRIYEYNQTPDINLLKKPLKINYSLINNLKNKSINYLKNNLGIK